MKRQLSISAVTVAAALLATACGSSPSATAPTSTTAAGAESAVAYSQCMRSHGIPDFPGPDSSGDIPKQAIIQLHVSNSLMLSASAACANLNPRQAPSAAQQRQQLADDLKFAQCMRSHGLPKFPDPTNNDGKVEFVLSTSQDGFDPHSPQVLAIATACQRLTLPAGSGLPSVTETS
jgi:hypothetical protein